MIAMVPDDRKASIEEASKTCLSNIGNLDATVTLKYYYLRVIEIGLNIDGFLSQRFMSVI